MKRILPLLFLSLPAAAAWTYDSSARTLTQGDVVLPNGVTTMRETFLKTKITSLVCGTGLATVEDGDGLCQSCTTITNVVFQSGCGLG